MELLLYAVIFSMILIVSNATNKLVPSLPLPLIQILLGIGWALFVPEENFHLDTELFLALVIGPLLFREAEEADITSVLKHWRIILYLIFPVIFISTISLGWAAHSLWLSLPLAACMAVGAALGPTDLVAFASLSERFSFPKRVSNILKGEGLLNDASGLVAFRVALAALATGSFSLGEAGVSLGISIIGGFAVGILTAFVNRWLQTLLLSVRASDIASELLLELSLPLLTFFLAEELHVSGIIAVVVSGILKASRFKHITLLEARVDTVSHTVWNTVNFILNGSVFVILGMELEMISKPILSSPIYNNLLLVLSVFLLTALLFLIRFVMVYLFYWFRTVRLKKSLRNYLKDALLLTFSGVKGTVSIATILLIPTKIEKEYPILLQAEISFDGIATQIMPIGADEKNSQNRSSDNKEEQGPDVTRKQIDISSVNGGKIWVEDAELVAKFGVIRKPVIWTEIDNPQVLKNRGLQYLRNQRIALAKWTVSAVERYLIDRRYVKFKIGNTHPILNAPLSGIERLQIIEKKIDVLNPQSVDLVIGSKSQSLSAYQLQSQEAIESIERVKANQDIESKREKLSTLTSELERLRNERKPEHAERIRALEAEINKIRSELGGN